MTIDEFVAELARATTSESIKWGLETTLGSGYLNAIRVRRGWDCYCPITMLCHTKMGMSHSVIHYLTAGKDIGLTVEDTLQVMWTADRRSAQSGYYDPALRARLLAACGLEEAA